MKGIFFETDNGESIIVNHKEHNRSPLCEACQIKDPQKAKEMTEVLLRLGFDPNKEDDIGQTCLFYAARFGQISVLGVLKQTQADFNHADHQGQTPIFYAACYSDKVETLQTLVNYGSLPNHVDSLAG